MLYVSSASGESFDQTMKEIYDFDDPFESVVHYANQ